MRVALISDVHANLEALRAILSRIAGESVDRILCLGDIVGYNADPAACIALLRECGALCVAGNHDRAVAGQLPADGFPPHAARAVAWTRDRLDPDALAFLAGLPSELCMGNRLVAVHGALHPADARETTYLATDAARLLSFAALAAHPSGARLCAFGHTHMAGVFELRGGRQRSAGGDETALRDDALYLLNPGTVGQPRGTERRATFAVLDTGRRSVALRRVAYDAEAARAKTRAAGLEPGAPAGAGRMLARIARRLLRAGGGTAADRIRD